MAKALVGAPIGADVDAIVAGGLNAAGVSVTGLGAPAQLGTVVNGLDGTRYILVQAASTSAALASAKAPNAYAISNTFRAKLMTSTQAAAGLPLGFAPNGSGTIAAHAYFWVRCAGTGFTARVAASASAAKYLRTTTTAGRLGTASTASAAVFPVVITAIASASTSAGNTVRTVFGGQLAPIGITAIANAMAAP